MGSDGPAPEGVGVAAPSTADTNASSTAASASDMAPAVVAQEPVQPTYPASATPPASEASGDGSSVLEQVIDRARHTAEQVVEQAQDLTGHMVEQAKQTAGQVASGAQDTASHVTDRVVESVKDRVRRQAETVLASQKDDAAAILEVAARALLETGRGLGEQQRDDVAAVAMQAAARLSGASTYLRDHDVNELVDQTEHYLSALPATVLSTALAAGLVGANMLKKLDR